MAPRQKPVASQHRQRNLKPDREPTTFESRLYKLCKKIPKGKVVTYGTMAKVLKSAPRAVGQALRRNPFAPVVPCHRVVASTLELGGFKGCWGDATAPVQMKRGILLSEGVGFDGRKVAHGSVMDVSEFEVLHNQETDSSKEV